MPIQSSGAISIRDIQLVHNSASPTWQRVILGDFYRTSGYVQDLPANSEVPETQGDPISFDDFYGTTSPTVVEYELIGGGGGGGSGRNNGVAGAGDTDGDDGEDTSIDLSIDETSYFLQTATGADGGRASTNHTDNNRYSAARTGDSSYYGDGGAGGGLRANGGNAPAASYGAGGGGGGGNVDTNKVGGITNTDPSGEGGFASTRLTNEENYSLEIPFGTVMTVVIGAGGDGAVDNGTNGGNGAGGYVKISFDGTEYEYTAAGTYTVTL